MALTVSVRNRRLTSTRIRVSAKVTFDNSYPTGGEAYTAAMFGLDSIDSIEVASVANQGSRLCVLDADNAKIKVLTALSTEAANASDQSTISTEVTVVGVGSS